MSSFAGTAGVPYVWHGVVPLMWDVEWITLSGSTQQYASQ